MSKAKRSGMDDFIVDDDSDVEYETASSQDEDEPDEQGPELEWADGEDAEGKLRELLKSKGGQTFSTSLMIPSQISLTSCYDLPAIRMV